MKRKALLTIMNLIFIIPLCFAGGIVPEQKLKEANNFYEAGKITEAEQVYMQITEDGYESAALYYNLANCYYRMNDIGLSVYYYEKAKLLDPFDEDILYNAELAELRVKNKPSVIPDFAFLIFIKRFVRIVPPDIWAVFSFVFFIGCLFFVYRYLWPSNSRQKKKHFVLSAAFLFLSGIAFFVSEYQLRMINSDDRGIILSDEIAAKSSPDENASTLFSVYEGFKVKVEDSLNGWVEIKLTDGKKAWLKKEHIKFL